MHVMVNTGGYLYFQQNSAISVNSIIHYNVLLHESSIVIKANIIKPTKRELLCVICLCFRHHAKLGFLQMFLTILMVISHEIIRKKTLTIKLDLL